MGIWGSIWQVSVLRADLKRPAPNKRLEVRLKDTPELRNLAQIMRGFMLCSKLYSSGKGYWAPWKVAFMLEAHQNQDLPKSPTIQPRGSRWAGRPS